MKKGNHTEMYYFFYISLLPELAGLSKANLYYEKSMK